MRRLLSVLAVAGATLAGVAATAQAATVPPAPMPPPGAIGPPTVAVAPIVPQCTATPTLQTMELFQPGQDASSLCSKYGAALTPSMARLRRQTVHRLRSHATSLCISAGCTYVWLWNQGGGWAYTEAVAMPFTQYGKIEHGFAVFTRTTQNDPYTSNSGWTDDVLANDGPGWDGYRYIYPICNSSGQCRASWVNVGYTGQVLLSGPPPVLAGLGPVNTWNYIT